MITHNIRTATGATAIYKEFGIKNCEDLAEVWKQANPELLIRLASQYGVVDERTLQRFTCFSLRQVWHLLTDGRSRKAVEVVEAYSRNKMTLPEAWPFANHAGTAATETRIAACVAAYEKYLNHTAKNDAVAITLSATADASLTAFLLVNSCGSKPAARIAAMSAVSSDATIQRAQADWLRASVGYPF